MRLLKRPQMERIKGRIGDKLRLEQRRPAESTVRSRNAADRWPEASRSPRDLEEVYIK
jgi:hypothetical protein